MELTALDAIAYHRTFPNPTVIYNSTAFTALNADKVSAVVRVMLSDRDKPRLGITLGQRSGRGWAAPFSAPFACFDFNRQQSATTMLEATDVLRRAFPGMKLVLPPSFYSRQMISKTILAMNQCGIVPVCADWNYHFNLTTPGGYESLLSTDARKKYHRALKSGYRLEKVNEEPLRAYTVIEANRRHKGYPLKMTANQVLATTAPGGAVTGDFFVLTDGRSDLAAAIVFDVAHEVSQVIYWGDRPSSGMPYIMNLLAGMLYNYYRNRGKIILDIGPSSENGIASAGLCAFKESIGCEVTPKFTFIL